MTKNGFREGRAINKSNLLVLYQGKLDLRPVEKFGLAEMKTRVFCAVEKERCVGLIGIVISDPDTSSVIVEQFLGIEDYLNKPINDVLFLYRTMKVFEAFPTLPYKENLYVVLQSCQDWNDLLEESKKMICEVSGISPEIFEKTMRLIPPNFEETLLALHQAGIVISTGTIQKEVVAGNMEFTPFLKKIGVQSPDEFKKEKERIEAIIKRNLEHVRRYVENVIEDRYEENHPFVQISRRCLREAIIQGFEEDDLIVCFALFSVNFQTLDQAIEDARKFSTDPLGIAVKIESECPGVIVEAVPNPQIAELLRNKKEALEAEIKTMVSVFLVKQFPSKGRGQEYYQKIIDDIRKPIANIV